MPIELRGVEHGYLEGVPILRGLDLVVADGESVAITGPSGSGKSTLLAVIGLLLHPFRGTVLIDGIPAPRRGAALDDARAGQFGWVFQSSNALGRRTVADNVALGLLSRGKRRCETDDQVRMVLGSVGLDGLEEQPAFTLSGGELQRMVIARALVGRPRFVLADEPTGQLDRATSMLVVQSFLGSRPQGTSVVIATHDVLVAHRCDRVVTIENGLLLESA